MLWCEERKTGNVAEYSTCAGNIAPSKERSLDCELLPSLNAFLSLQIKLLSMYLPKCFSRQLVEHAWKKQSIPMEYTLLQTACHSALLVK